MDRYDCYAALAAHEREGRDYRVVKRVQDSPVLVMAPHGGAIEPATSEIAASIARVEHSLYCFEGLVAARPHGDLHIASSHFDEPRALGLVADATLVVTVHGRLNRTDPATIWLGGLDDDLVRLTDERLSDTGFACLRDTPELSGRSPANICNRGRSGRGLQMELPRDLRDALRADDVLLARLTLAVRAAISDRLAPKVEMAERHGYVR